MTIIAFSLLGLACEPSFDGPSTLNRPRPLGLRIEVQNGDGPSQSTPMPGATFEATLFLGRAAPAEETHWVLALCVAEGKEERPYCGHPAMAIVQGQIEAASATDETEALHPSATFVAPSAEVLAENNLLLVGAYCVGGPLAPPTNVFSPFLGQVNGAWEDPCGGEGFGAVAFAEVPVAFPDAPDQPNLNPSPIAVSMRLRAGEAPTALTQVAPAGTVQRCANYPVLSLTSTPWPFEFELAGSLTEFEFYVDDEDEDNQETHLVSSFATAGSFDPLLSQLDPETGSHRVAWIPPDAPSTEFLVRFYFVTRDSRGGVAFRSTALCITR